MTKIKHHLTEPLLMAYSTGTLPEAFSLVIATHISMCDDCRAQLEGFEAVGGAVLEDLDTSEMSSGSLEATLDLIKASDEVEQPVPVLKSGTPLIFPAPLLGYVGGDPASIKWRSIGMGVRQAILPTSKEATVRLLHIPAGVAVPDHGHRGMELTLVLQGAFKDATDRFGRGDIEVANEDLNHTPVAEPGQDCICLAATDAPLKFRGLIPKIAQQFLRI
ncbi:ChrR family anti-sigma-E factor [Pseudogemmobacter sp. W21_MBD1_M6]|uniref:ChrR family anti-sigma-E factor n=1 Tax=Pseudogemmobacter sp. W21_MBD1_M6 TaxID=3240271 RepID=UPI003F9CBCB1